MTYQYSAKFVPHRIQVLYRFFYVVRIYMNWTTNIQTNYLRLGREKMALHDMHIIVQYIQKILIMQADYRSDVRDIRIYFINFKWSSDQII